MRHTPEAHAPDALRTEPVFPSPRAMLVATDGSRDSDGAVRVGRALARRDDVAVNLLSVVEPLALFTAEGVPLPEDPEITTITRAAREITLLAQHERTHPGVHEWPVAIETGARVPTIIAAARQRGAAFILLGLGAHGFGARLAGRETALRVIREAALPVLAVPPDAWGVPHSALVGVDFTESSERAARLTLDLLAGEGTLYLAHVSSRTGIPQGDPRPWGEITTGGAAPELEALARRLAPPAKVRVEHVLLHGDPAHELLAFATQRAITLVATGTHGRSTLGRIVLGSVSTSLVRTAHCWLLVAP